MIQAKSTESMVDRNQQQCRQDQEEEVQNEAHHSKSNQNNFSPSFQKEEKKTQFQEENGEVEIIPESAIVTRNYNSYSVEIENDNDSTQSSDVDEDLEGDDLRDKGWVSEIPRSPQNCEVATTNGFALPTVELPSFGDVVVKNSTNVTLENRTFFKGPVTISTVVYSNSENKKEEEVDRDDEKRDSVPSQNSNGSDAPLHAYQDINKGDFDNIFWNLRKNKNFH